jgi:hypothetical protein
MIQQGSLSFQILDALDKRDGGRATLGELKKDIANLLDSRNASSLLGLIVNGWVTARPGMRRIDCTVTITHEGLQELLRVKKAALIRQEAIDKFQKETELLDGFIKQGAEPFLFKSKDLNATPVYLQSLNVQVKTRCPNPCCLAESPVVEKKLHILTSGDLKLFILRCGCGHEQEISLDDLNRMSRRCVERFMEK